ncbi:condensin complex subunit 2 [Drosophila novamexicana]|uniref:condensin complex subunit 2 n=1 Tax=Drosophila novamexicana TaxID=47314 RepID=UPI0011E5A40A|nr:condensin complex subunit 2 [Drosophila novamexicana]
MTLPRSETPLRRSAVGSHRESMLRDLTTMVNDDEAERREARRRTLLQQQTRPRDSSVLESIEENETIRKCLEIYNGNKLSRDNAWSLSLIDTLSSLLDRHHKTLSNFKMAGSSLEASSKVYGLRVDSIYLDAMRMSAGLSARTLTEKQLNAAADRDESIADHAEDGAADGIEAAPGSAPKAKKRTRKPVSTVTKNKETLNARLDTAPLQDPVFGKLNSTVGSINASNRLMHNILPTVDSELRLRTNYRFWQNQKLPEEVQDYTIVDSDIKNLDTQTLVSAEWAKKLRRYDQQLKLRPLHTGYIITDAPNPINANDPAAANLTDNNDMGVDNADDFYENPRELSMAFDINAECEPIPELDAPAATVLEVDYNELEELTTEERTTLQHCRALRKQTVLIEDLRPVDGSSKLEYSYRPMDQISQFWAGPSHWKFKRVRARSTLGHTNAQDNIAAGGSGGTAAAARIRRAALQAAKRRSKQLNFGQCTENLFQTLDSNTKLRKANYQKRWDARKLMLPTKFEFEPNYFYRYDYAPSIKVSRRYGVQDDDEDEMDRDTNTAADDAADDVELFDNDHFEPDTPHSPGEMNVSTMILGGEPGATILGGEQATCGNLIQGNTTMRNNCNDTVLEIATDFEGAPTQVTKVIVPFAKRAKVIDMKNLKRSCNSLIQKQLLSNATMEEEKIPAHAKAKEEHYAKGMASFKEVYDKLPSVLSTKMADSLSPSVALYAVLHLANDMRLRLIPQDDFENFTIRQVSE